MSSNIAFRPNKINEVYPSAPPTELALTLHILDSLYPRRPRFLFQRHYLTQSPGGDNHLQVLKVKDAVQEREWAIEVIGTIDLQDIIIYCENGPDYAAVRCPWPQSQEEAEAAVKVFYKAYVPFVRRKMLSLTQ
jgi:hypothetical protein